MSAGVAMLALLPVFSRKVAAGAPPPSTNGFVHLDFNESPYGPPEKAREAIREAIESCGRYYPDVEYDALRTLLGKHHGLTAENILLGAGSVEILKMCDDVFLRRGGLVVADPTFDAVIGYARNSRATPSSLPLQAGPGGVTKIPLTKDFRHDLTQMAKAVTRDTGMVYLCNPNNPTGTIVTREEMERFLDRIPDSVAVVVDEAYSHYASTGDFESAVRYVQEGRKVIVARTFSKIYGLPAMRVGYAIAKKEIIEQLKPFGVRYAVSGHAAHAAAAALSDKEHVERVARRNRIQLMALYDEMKSAKFDCIPSQANFAMIHVRRPVAPVIQEFAKRKILVGREFPGMTDYLRVTMGSEEQMKRFVVAFREIKPRLL